MGDNLPDDVSPADIDRHFGGPDGDVVVRGTVQVAADAIARRSDSDREKREALMDAVRDGEIIQVLEATIDDEQEPR